MTSDGLAHELPCQPCSQLASVACHIEAAKRGCAARPQSMWRFCCFDHPAYSACGFPYNDGAKQRGWQLVTLK